jgi:hypothetical protein|tara:strand:+ start:29 stop:217 length:189 start_codon:yes stop_codon:yes gene_type:complete
MNKTIMNELGFEKEVEQVEKNICPFCHEKVPFGKLSFKDDVSFNEFKISGLCQKCQDKTFNS